MADSHTRIPFPQIGITVLLGLILLAGNISNALSFVLLVPQSPLFSYLFPLVTLSALAIWVQYDSRSTGVSIGLDQAYYIMFLLPITFPVYLLRAHKFRNGCLLILFFIGLYILTLLPTVFLFFIPFFR